jgi:hypothetical protein
MTFEKPLLSILIPTIVGREESSRKLFNQLVNVNKRFVDYYNLNQQELDSLGLFYPIELRICQDNKGENTIGKKRNWLLAQATGYFTCFIDDDDRINEDVLFDILKHIQHLVDIEIMDTIDCFKLVGEYTENGSNPKTFIHSIEHDEWFEKDDVYFRPPNHLNIIKTDIAKQFVFPEINHGEDKEWSMKIKNSGLLKNEEYIKGIYYFYDFITNK